MLIHTTHHTTIQLAQELTCSLSNLNNLDNTARGLLSALVFPTIDAGATDEAIEVIDIASPG
jgi:hypothetical protein